MLKTRADRKEPTEKPGTRALASIITRVLTTRVNSPRVTMVSGKVNSINSGLTKVFRRPRTTATRTAVQNESMSTPGTTEAATSTARAFKTRLIIILISFIVAKRGSAAKRKRSIILSSAMNRKLYFNITNSCNLACRYCYYNTGLEKRIFHKLEPDKIIRTIPKLRKLFDEIIFTGGEPLLYPQVFDIAAACKRNGFAISLLTNGTLLTERNVEKIIKTGFDTVSVSMDSLSPEVNNYQRGRSEQLYAGLQNLIRQRPRKMTLEIMQTVSRKNIDDILSILKYAQKHRLVHWVDPVEINPDRPELKEFDLYAASEKELAKLEQNMLKWADGNELLLNYAYNTIRLIKKEQPIGLFCPMGTYHFVVDVDGEVYPCFLLKQIKLGNLWDGDPEKIFKGNTHYATKMRPVLQKAGCVSLGCICMTLTGNY